MTAQAAMHRAYAAWRNTQAQLELELVLDETAETLPGCLVEHQRSPAGAEPCCGPSLGLTGSPAAAPPAPSSGSAPPHTIPGRE